ncbi:uncharacterized protein LOC120104917 [Phoenix dactylifera]|uniref:Uncharacterized protein LOC120104917 n=1 Tax=Phoenix dactylifera TaxID=42345 RepID=A0A8B8ZMB7_PHODC|nr:uncharacterized protein LOC120104917 [Phoenix dactylifera]
MVISEGDRRPWVLSAVYASTDYRVRRALWEEASQMISHGHPMLMAGDFNCIVDSQEKMGGNPFSLNRKIKEFQDFISTNGLIDLGFSGPRFTWCNNQQGRARVWERLDRACATAGWVQSFPDYHVRHLPRIASDHCPLLVSTEAHIPVRSPFRRNQNRIRSIRSEDGQMSDDPARIRRIVECFFRARWTEQAGEGGRGEMVMPAMRVSEEETAALIRPISVEEIREVIWSLEGDKAPGPDGFPPLFFRRYWLIVGQDVTAAIQQFFTTAVMSADWQRTFITLIPKRRDASEPGHFRPISLCTTMYKATAKILATRMRGILLRLISPEQGAFIGGRSISDNIMIAQEFMFDLERAPMRRCLMGVKLDMERAYDRMRWEFVHQSLQGFGFPEEWIRWIMGCVRFPSFAILVNGTPSRYFVPVGGLRQGCPLSPLLFIICADALSRVLRQSMITQELGAYRPAVEGPSISHLLFADDCLLLARATRRDARALGRILRDYCAMSGQRVNFSKSAVCFSPSTRQVVRHSISEILGVGEHGGVMRYLGVPLSGRRLRGSDCSFLEATVRQRMEGWQLHSLSMMGRVTLARSVLSSIPIYLLSHAFIPVSVLRSIEQLVRNFIWGRQGGRGGIHLLAWEVVCQPTRYGGLGVQSLLVRREALVARHAARYVLEPDSMWSSLMRAKYGALAAGVRAGRRHSFVWREMCARAGEVLLEIRWAIGDGRSVDVLEDCWVTAVPISRMPTLVDSVRLAGRRVSDLLDPDVGGWREGLVREVFGAQLAAMILGLPVPFQGESDRLVWVPSGRSQVRARDLYALFSRESPRRMEGGWIWRMRIHPRVALFIWKVAWGCLPTRSVLVRRGMRVPQECVVCPDIEETIQHVLLQCPRAREIWRSSPAPIPHSVGSTQDFIQLLRTSVRSPRLVEEGIIRAYLAYHIWLDRNARLFEGRRISAMMVAERAVLQAGEVLSCFGESSLGMTRDIWDTRSAVLAPSVATDRRSGGAGFVIRDHFGSLVAAGGWGTTGLTVVGAELWAAWAGMSYARQVLGASRLYLEGDSSIVIDWIRGADRYGDGHPLIRETRRLAMEMDEFQAVHIFREANRAADWVASHVARHSGELHWTSTVELPPHLISHWKESKTACHCVNGSCL